MASTGSVDGWPLGPTELGEAGLRVLLRLPTQASSSYTELKSSCARHDVRIRISCLLVARPFPPSPSPFFARAQRKGSGAETADLPRKYNYWAESRERA